MKKASESYLGFAQGSIDIETTGPMGGDAGHGGVTKITIDETTSGFYEVKVKDQNEKIHTFDYINNAAHEISIEVRGDDELNMLDQLFNFAAKEIRKFNSVNNTNTYSKRLELVQNLLKNGTDTSILKTVLAKLTEEEFKEIYVSIKRDTYFY